MTFIAGYIYNDAAHIVADSAESVEMPGFPDIDLPDQFQGSMFEPAVVRGGDLVIDAAQKIYNLNGLMLLAFAGTVGEGTETIYQILTEYTGKDTMKKFIWDFFENSKPQDTEYIIAFRDEGISQLYFYRNQDSRGFLTDNLSICCVGINRFVPPDDFIQIIALAAERNHAQQEVLINVISNLQLMTSNLNTIEDGVGGHFNGAYLDSIDIHWAADTVYLLYSGLDFNIKDIKIVAKFNRDNAVFVRSHIRQILFLPDINGFVKDEFNEKWGSALTELANSYEATYYVLISKDTGVILLINNLRENLWKVTVTNGVLALSNELFLALKEMLKNRSNYEFRIVIKSNFP